MILRTSVHQLTCNSLESSRRRTVWSGAETVYILFIFSVRRTVFRGTENSSEFATNVTMFPHFLTCPIATLQVLGLKCYGKSCFRCRFYRETTEYNIVVTFRKTAALCLLHGGVLLGSLFRPEDGSDTRSGCWLPPDRTALCSRR